MINKKAITPLMITILLISLAVAVGVGIMNLGRAQVEQGAECAINIGLHFAQISAQQQLCYDAAGKKLSFTVENGVNIKVEGLIVNIIGAQKAESFELNEAKIIKAGTYVANIPFDRAVGGPVKQLKITPKVRPADEEIICQEQALVLENIKDC